MFNYVVLECYLNIISNFSDAMQLVDNYYKVDINIKRCIGCIINIYYVIFVLSKKYKNSGKHLSVVLKETYP